MSIAQNCSVIWRKVNSILCEMHFECKNCIGIYPVLTWTTTENIFEQFELHLSIGTVWADWLIHFFLTFCLFTCKKWCTSNNNQFGNQCLQKQETWLIKSHILVEIQCISMSFTDDLECLFGESVSHFDGKYNFLWIYFDTWSRGTFLVEKWQWLIIFFVFLWWLKTILVCRN